MLNTRWHLGHAVLLALALACFVQAWQVVGALRAPLPVPPPFTAPPLADRALLARFDPFFPARAASGESLPVTALPFSLHGVRADSSTGRGSAIIASGDGVQQVYAVGDLISDGVSLAAIAREHVVLERGGVREALWLDSAGSGAVQRFDALESGAMIEPLPDDESDEEPRPEAPRPEAPVARSSDLSAMMSAVQEEPE